MKHRLAPHLLGLLLLATAACSKKKAPGPTLEGTWQHERATFAYQNPDGTLRTSTNDVYPAGQRQLTLTANQWIYQNSMLGSTSTSEYTRQDNILTVWRAGSTVVTPTSMTIVELTAHRLHLQTSTSSSLADDYYTR